jgi:hypothetical protein
VALFDLGMSEARFVLVADAGFDQIQAIIQILQPLAKRGHFAVQEPLLRVARSRVVGRLAENRKSNILFGLPFSNQKLCYVVMASETPDGGFHDGVKTETIRIFASREDADLAAANLQAHGIRCWINTDDGGGMLPNLTAPGGVHLLVQASDSAAGIALLANPIPPAEIPNQNESEPALPFPARAAPRKAFAPGQFFVGIVAGVVLCLLYQSYNQRGTKTRYHHNENSVNDEAWVYRDGHLVEFMKDRNLDGAWDHWTHYKDGQMALVEDDNNFDGKPDETWTYSHGALLKMEKDTDFNGTPDMFCTYKYGVIQQVDYRPNGAKFATQRQLYQNGVLVEILRRADANGNFNEAVRYDPFFNPISTNTPQ